MKRYLCQNSDKRYAYVWFGYGATLEDVEYKERHYPYMVYFKGIYIEQYDD